MSSPVQTQADVNQNGAPHNGRTALIHIGLPKTGTTTIQRFLSMNADVLSKHGIHTQDAADYAGWSSNAHAGAAIATLSRAEKLIPNPALRKRLNIKTLADQARYAEEFESRFADFITQKGSGTFVVSGESMFNLLKSSDLIQNLDGFFARYFSQRTYLIYLRDQSSWITSQYSQMITSGGTQPIEHIIATAERTDQYAQIALWDDCLPDAGFTLRLFEQDTLKDGDLLSDFCAVIGANIDTLQRPENLNISSSALELALFKFANRVHLNRAAHRMKRLLNMVIQPRARRRYRLPADHQDRVTRAFVKSNEKLRARYFPDRPTLFSFTHPVQPSATLHVN